MIHINRNPFSLLSSTFSLYKFYVNHPYIERENVLVESWLFQNLFDGIQDRLRKQYSENQNL